MKKCYTCQKEKSLIEFNKNKSRKDGINSICRECSRQRSKLYYTDHKDAHKKTVYGYKKRYVTELRKWVSTEIKKGGCCICDEKESICLDLHHVNSEEKTGWIHKLISDNSRTRLVEELNKCAVVCSNCHRKIHAGLIPNPVEKKLNGIKLPT